MVFCSRALVIPVVSLRGVISSSSKLSFKTTYKLLEKAFEMPFIKTVAIVINSPGGSPVQSELIYKYIRRLAKENEVEVITFVEDCAASGGYYLACAGDEIYASNSSILGSIGVISSGFGFTELIKKHGIERRVYAQGENKAVLDPFLPERDADIEILNDVGKDIHQEFIEHVKERRGSKLDMADTTLFTGKFWSGKKAKELGLIDGVGDMYSVLEKKHGENIKLRYITENKSFFSMLTDMMNTEMIGQGVVEAAVGAAKDASVWARIGM